MPFISTESKVVVDLNTMLSPQRKVNSDVGSVASVRSDASLLGCARKSFHGEAILAIVVIS